MVLLSLMFCVILYHGLNRSFCWLSFLDLVRKYTKEQLLKIAGHYGLTLRLLSSRQMVIKVVAEKHSLGLEPVVAPLVTTRLNFEQQELLLMQGQCGQDKFHIRTNLCLMPMFDLVFI